MTFRSDRSFQNAVVEVIGDVATFVTISPSSFASVPAGQDQTVQLSFSVPQGTALGTLNGTIQVKSGNQTLSQTLGVVLNVWDAFSSGVGHYEIKVPPLLKATSEPIEPIPPGTAFAVIDSTLFVGPAPDGLELYAVQVFDNPSNLSIMDWITQTGISPYPTVDTATSTSSISGVPGIQMSSQSALRLGFYVTTKQRVYVLEWPNYDPTNSAALEQFLAFASSLQFQ